MANLLSTTVNGSLLIGPSGAAHAYNGAATGKLYFGNQVSDSPTHYHITTNMEDYNGNYSKLDFRWYTGQRFYAHFAYGGFRFHEITTNAELFSVGKGDAHVRVENNLYVGNTIYNNGNAVIHAGNIGSQSVSYASSAGNSATTSQTVFNDLKTIFHSGSGGGHSFAVNHYSMGLDSGNGEWSHPHYRDLIIGYHTGIRIGANYSGIRFYNNSPTTDANNDGNGDVGEALLMTIGGYVGTANHTDVVVNNNLIANSSLRAPIFYDSDNTTYYVDPNSESNLSVTRTALRARQGMSGYGAGNWVSDFSNTAVSSMTFGQDKYDGGPTGTWWFQVNMRHNNGSDLWGTQLAYGWEDNANEIYQRNVTGGNWSGWVRYINTNNYAGILDSRYYTESESDGRYARINTWGGGSYYIGTNGDIYGTRFYDSSDSAYYVDPNGNSVLTTATFNLNASSTIAITSAGTNASMIKAGAGDELYIGGNDTWQMRFNSGNVLMDNGGYLQNNQSLRAPIFYDSDNTYYYVDPNSTSKLVSTRIIGGELRFNNDSYYHDLEYWGARMFSQDDGNGVPLYVQVQWVSGWNTALKIASGQDNNNPSLRTYGITQLASDGGFVGIRTTDPQAELDVNGRIAIRSSNRLYFGHTTTLNSWTTAQYASSSTHIFNAQAFVFNNEGYGSAEYMRINTSGNVGIGETNPTTKLYIKNTSGDAAITLQGSSQTMRIDQNSIRTLAASQIAIFTNNTATNGIYISSAGNVGIGTTSPSYKLDVSGQVRVDNGVGNGSGLALVVQGSGDVSLSDGGSLFFGAYDYGASTYIRGYDNNDIMYFHVNGTNVAYFRSDRAYFNANVGIGTTSPISKLDIVGSHTGGYGILKITSTDSAFISVDAGNNDGGLRLKYNTNDQWLIGTRGNDKLQFNNAADQPKLVIQQDGNVGIGISNPQHKLDVAGNISLGDWTKAGATYVGLRRADDGSFGGGGDSGLVVDSYNHASPWNGNYSQRVHLRTHLYNGGSHNVLTAYGFNVGIGVNDPSYKLHVEGDAYASGIISTPNYIKAKSTYRNNPTAGLPGQANPVKTASGVLATYSDNGGSYPYIIIKTRIPQDWFQMGGFTIDLFGDYYNSNNKTTISLGGYWDPENNGGFIGFEYNTTNPNVRPDITVMRDITDGMTCFAISGMTWSYPQVVARDLFLGYFSTDIEGGLDWSIFGADDLGGYINNDAVVCRNAIPADQWYGNTYIHYDGRHYGTIFYDSNDTNYYCDPNNTSRLHIIKLSTDQWNQSSDGYNRFYFGNNARTYFGSGNGYEFRSAADANIASISNAGDFVAAGDVTAYSDARIKTNVQTIENALDKTLKLRGVTYNRTDSEDTSTKVGVIAQEILEVIPEVVKQNDEGMYSVSYGNLTAVLIEAIKEQQKQIDELKEIINGLTK